MELNVAKELKLAGLVSSMHIEERVGPYELSGRTIELTEPISMDVDYSFDGEGFRVSGHMASAVRMNCTKCDAEFIEPFEIDFNERFLKVSENEAEELDCYSFSGESLVLDKMVRDLIMLDAPMYGLCKPDCRGLCPICGTNLNITQCSCTIPDESNPFAALKGLAELFKED